MRCLFQMEIGKWFAVQTLIHSATFCLIHPFTKCPKSSFFATLANGLIFPTQGIL